MSTGRLTAARRYLGLNRNVAVLALSIFGQGLGEELWQSYLPKYLTALGASGVAVGSFSSLKDVLDGLYQYPGGWAGDRFGRKRALTLFYVSGGEGFISIFTQLDTGKYQPVAKIPTAARARFALCSRARTTLFGRSSSQ